MKAWRQVPTGHLRWFLVFIVSMINLFAHSRWPSTRIDSSKAMRSIDRAWQISRARNAPFPWEFLSFKQGPKISSERWNSLLSNLTIRLWLQGDNCPKEVRNSFTGKWACLLSQANYFVGVSHHHLVVGHTHEDIGVFAQNHMVTMQ